MPASYLERVSIWRIEKLIESSDLPAVQVAGLGEACNFDEHLESFRTRRLDASPNTLAADDTLTLMIRGGRVEGLIQQPPKIAQP